MKSSVWNQQQRQHCLCQQMLNCLVFEVVLFRNKQSFFTSVVLVYTLQIRETNHVALSYNAHLKGD